MFGLEMEHANGAQIAGALPGKALHTSPDPARRGQNAGDRFECPHIGHVLDSTLLKPQARTKV